MNVLKGVNKICECGCCCLSSVLSNVNMNMTVGTSINLFEYS